MVQLDGAFIFNGHISICCILSIFSVILFIYLFIHCNTNIVSVIIILKLKVRDLHYWTNYKIPRFLWIELLIYPFGYSVILLRPYVINQQMLHALYYSTKYFPIIDCPRQFMARCLCPCSFYGALGEKTPKKDKKV